MTVSPYFITLAGGKTANRTIYMQYTETYPSSHSCIAKLKWPESDVKPTLLSTTTIQNIAEIIRAQNPTMSISDSSPDLMGATDYGSCFFVFLDNITEKRWIAEIGSSAITTEGPIWGNNNWEMNSFSFGIQGACMTGGMSSENEETILGFGIGGMGWRGEAYTYEGRIRAAIYTGGTLSDPTGATLLWDVGIVTIGPHGDIGSRWEVDHPSGGVALPADSVTWIALKFYDPLQLVKVLFLNTRFSAGDLPVGSSTCGDFQDSRGSYWLNADPSLFDDFEPNAINDAITVAFPATIPSGGIWDGAPEWKAKLWTWPITYLKLAETEESSSSSSSQTPDPEATGWQYLRLIDWLDHTSGLAIESMEICEDTVYLVSGNVPTESTYLSDNFTGDDDDPPNSRKWEIVTGSPDIQDNKLELTQIGATGTQDLVRIIPFSINNYSDALAEVSVDFELINYAATSEWGIDLILFVNDHPRSDEIVAYVRFGWWDGEYQYRVAYNTIYGWSTTDVGIGASPDTTGKLRFVYDLYVSSILENDPRLRGCYWDGSDWVEIASREIANLVMIPGLRVYNATASQDITWRADNYRVTTGTDFYRTIYSYERSSFNSDTKRFETLVASKSTTTNETWIPIVAGTNGCALALYKGGWYLQDIPYYCYNDIVIYDSELNEVAQVNIATQYLLGEMCTWQRDIYDPYDFYASIRIETLCGDPQDCLFITGNTLFINGIESQTALIEIDSTTLRPTRASVLATTAGEFDGTEIQDAIDVP